MTNENKKIIQAINQPDNLALSSIMIMSAVHKTELRGAKIQDAPPPPAKRRHPS